MTAPTPTSAPTTTLLTPLKSRLFIVARRKTWGLLDGEYSSVFRGRSLDYDDLREYVAGDEVRDIDWKATARHGSPLVKRWVATRYQTVLFVVDTSRGMAAQTGDGSPKSAAAISVVGMLGFLALRHSDRVALVEGDDCGVRWHPPGRTEAHLEGLLQQVDNRTEMDSGSSRLGDLLRYVAQHVRHRMLLVVVADERPLDSADEVLVRRMHAQHEVLWFTVQDADPTRAGRGRDALDVGDDALIDPQVRGGQRLHDAYQRVMTEQRATLDAILERHGIVHARVASVDAVLPAVFRALERQGRRGR